MRVIRSDPRLPMENEPTAENRLHAPDGLYKLDEGVRWIQGSAHPDIEVCWLREVSEVQWQEDQLFSGFDRHQEVKLLVEFP